MINEFDEFVLLPILTNYKEIIGERYFKKIAKEYKSLYGKKFPSKNVDLFKVDYILKKIFGKKSNKINKDSISMSLQLEEINKEKWIVTDDIDICLRILNSYGDSYKKIILDSLIYTANVTLNLVSRGFLPQASGYRKIKELIHDGLLVSNGTKTKGEGRKAIVYETLLNGIGIWIEGDSMKVHFKVKKGFLKNSFAYEILQGIKTEKIHIKI